MVTSIQRCLVDESGNLTAGEAMLFLAMIAGFLIMAYLLLTDGRLLDTLQRNLF